MNISSVKSRCGEHAGISNRTRDHRHARNFSMQDRCYSQMPNRLLKLCYQDTATLGDKHTVLIID